MNCPYCNQAMQSGFIQSGHGVHWTNKRHAFTGLFYSLVESVNIGNGLMGEYAKSYLCKNCETVIIPYGRNKEELAQEEED